MGVPWGASRGNPDSVSGLRESDGECRARDTGDHVQEYLGRQREGAGQGVVVCRNSGRDGCRKSRSTRPICPSSESAALHPPSADPVPPGRPPQDGQACRARSSPDSSIQGTKRKGHCQLDWFPKQLADEQKQVHIRKFQFISLQL